VSAFYGGFVVAGHHLYQLVLSLWCSTRRVPLVTDQLVTSTMEDANRSIPRRRGEFLLTFFFCTESPSFRCDMFADATVLLDAAELEVIEVLSTSRYVAGFAF